MKVLFASRLDFGLRLGGVQLQVRSTKRVLEERGVQVVLCNPWIDSLEGVDLLHCFTLSAELLPYVVAAVQKNIPVVVSPVFNTPAGRIATHLQVQMAKRLPGFAEGLKAASRITSAASRLVALSPDEACGLEEVFGASKNRTVVVPNGVEERFLTADPKAFLDRYGHRPDVLFVGRIDRNKNLLGLVRALQATNLSLAVIGSPYPPEREVFESFRATLGDRILYVGVLDHNDDLLPAAYAASRVFCLPSYKEVMPLTVLEAIAAGCQVVLTRNSCLQSLLGTSVRYVNPKREDEIRESILGSLSQEADVELRRRVASEFTWRGVGERLEELYREVLGIG